MKRFHALFACLSILGCSGVGAEGTDPTNRPAEVTETLALGTYQIESLVLASGRCLDVTGAGSADGTKLQEWSCNGGAAQTFRVEDAGGGLARIVNVASGKCVDVAGAGTADGTQVQLWTCNGSAAQSYRISDAGSARIQILNPNSNRCLDVNAGSTADGAKVQIWSCNGTNAQLWHAKAPSGTSSCQAPAWVSGQSYVAGDQVTYQGQVYVAKFANPGYIPTVSTYFWAVAPCTPNTPDTPVVPVTGGLPAKVVAGYYPNWTEAPVRIRDVNTHYNVIYLFAAKPVGGAPGTTGALTFDLPGDGRGAASNFTADIQYARTTQGRKILLSVGGAGAGMSFPNRAKSQTFVDSVSELSARFGGLDGLDWNTFEANQNPDTSEMIWISLELKRRFPGFVISAPPAPWNQRDKTFCAAMAQAGALDYAAPQYYDGPGLAVQSYITQNVADWVALLGASKVVVGFGIWDQPNYMTVGAAVSTWNQLRGSYPALRGAFDWTIHLDEGQGFPFANQVGPLVSP